MGKDSEDLEGVGGWRKGLSRVLEEGICREVMSGIDEKLGREKGGGLNKTEKRLGKWKGVYYGKNIH